MALWQQNGLKNVLPKLYNLRLCNFASKVQPDHNNKDDQRKQKQKKVQPPKKIPSEIKEQFFKNDQLKEIILKFPEKFLKKKHKGPEQMYIANPAAAKLIAPHLTAGIRTGDIPLVEVNPGLGLLTQELIENGSTNLRLYESCKEFVPMLEKQFPPEKYNKLKIKHGDLNFLWKLAYQDKMDNGNRVHEFLYGLPTTEWNDGINFRLFTCTSSDSFFKHILNSIAFQTSIMSLGRCEFYMVLPPPLYLHLTCRSETGYMLYRATSILFQIMFTYEFIAKIPRNHFLPYQFKTDETRNTQLSKFRKIDADHMYFIKAVPRKDLYQLCNPKDLPALWYFVKQNCVSRKNKVILTLEKYIPGIGAEIIKNCISPDVPKPIFDNVPYVPQWSTVSTHMSTTDFFKDLNIFTEFGELSPSQMLTLFLQFRNSRGYEHSSFLASMESHLLKMETSSDGAIEIKEVIDENENIPAEDAKHRKDTNENS